MRSKAIVDAVELSIYDFDKSLLFKEKEMLELKFKEINELIKWKEARDKVRIEQLIAIQAGDKIKKWINWYKEKLALSKTIADSWLDDVIENIQSEIELQISTDEFKLLSNGKIKLVGD